LELLTYKRLLYYLYVFFQHNEFDSGEVSRRFIELLAPIDGARLLTNRFNTILISNRLRRLLSYGLVERGKKEVPIEFVAKSGRVGHRGGHFKYKISSKGFRYLGKTKIGLWSGKELGQAMLFSYARKIHDPTSLALADSIGALPPSLKGISSNRRTRLPNGVTLHQHVNKLADVVNSIFQEMKEEAEVKRQMKDLERREAERVRDIDKVSMEMKKGQKEREEEFERMKPRLIAETEAEKKRILGGLLKNLEPFREIISQISPEAKELTDELFTKGDSEQEDSSEKGSKRPDSDDDASV
jgi:hypothetical protein